MHSSFLSRYRVLPYSTSTHTACSAHMLEVDVMSLLWPFSLMDVFMITFSSYPTPSHTFPLCCDFWIYLQAIFAWGLFNKPLTKCARTHADTHTAVFSNGRPDSSRQSPAKTHAQSHIHTAAFWDWWLLRQLLCTTFLFNQSYKSICIYCYHSSCSRCVFLLQVSVAQLNVTTVSL